MLRIDLNDCKRCGYSWKPRKIKRPDRCPKCRAWSWWKDKLVKRAVIKGRRGRPCKYPVHVLNVGQQMVLEWPENVLSMRQSIQAYAIRSGRLFVLESLAEGLQVRRTL